MAAPCDRGRTVDRSRHGCHAAQRSPPCRFPDGAEDASQKRAGSAAATRLSRFAHAVRRFVPDETLTTALHRVTLGFLRRRAHGTRRYARSRFCLSEGVMTRHWTIVAIVALAAAACSSSSSLTNSDGESGSAAETQCRWPDALNGADGRTACHPARALVECHDPAGNGCGCETDGAITCDCSAVSSGGSWTCVSTCAATAYVVSCGGVGPGPVPDPPAGCTSAGALPAGIAYYCCPCE